MIEVTDKHEIVWEYISPYWGKYMKMNMVYRAYRVPYDWVPQAPKPQENPVKRLEVTTFRVPGASLERKKESVVAGVLAYQPSMALCIADDGEEKK